MTGGPEMFFVMNADVCGDFPLQEMLDFHRTRPSTAICTMLATEATRQQSLTYGCVVENKDTHEILHYVEKPETFVSTTINCGIYLLTPGIFQPLEVAFKKNLEENYSFDFQVPSKEVIRLEQDVFVPMAATGTVYVFQSTRFWSQIKSAG
nr:hypothetical protein BaRGS_024427 [Batillaria attramentaria]